MIKQNGGLAQRLQGFQIRHLDILQEAMLGRTFVELKFQHPSIGFHIESFSIKK